MEHHNITTHEQEPLCLSKHEEIRSISKGARFPKGARHTGLPTKVHLFQWNYTTFDSAHNIFGNLLVRFQSQIYSNVVRIACLEWCTKESALL